VLTTSPFTLIGELGGGNAGLDPQVVLDLMLGPYDDDTDHGWHRFERGEISAAEYGLDLLERATAAGVEIDFGALNGVMDRLVVHDVVVDRVRALREEGYRTGLVTNNVKEAAGQWRALVRVEELFEVVVDSSEVGMRKPNPAIFLHALELLGGVEPSAAVFLDDAAGNVLGAQRAGLHAILVDATDPVPALEALDVILVSSP
jgi:epoxide hydrolase-like predicted phosphatase